MKRNRILPLCLCILATLLPQRAAAQVDEVVSAVLNAVRPTPVQDMGLIAATQDLAGKIDRLNDVLFGGAEVTSGAYRYRTMYGDLLELTTEFTRLAQTSYDNAVMMERMYSSLSESRSGVYDWGLAAQRTWHTYDVTIREASRIIARFKALFLDPAVTNAEVRQAAHDAMRDLQEQSLRESGRLRLEMDSARIAQGLKGSLDFMTPSPAAYVQAAKATYGTTLKGGTGAGGLSPFGKVIYLVIIGMVVIHLVMLSYRIAVEGGDISSLIVRFVATLVVSSGLLMIFQTYLP